MCGIAGILRPGASATAEDATAVRRMLDVQAHRGPDGAALHCEGPVVLGHRRLSIIDLSDAGREPMPNEDGTVWVTYNGETYNFEELRAELVARGHRFRSRTDGEVVVHGYETWGVEGLLARLRGMFAFALYDARATRLVLGRDRLGIKPLYYAAPPGRGLVAFASEVKALTRSGTVADEADPDALVGFLALGSVPSPRTIVRAVRCLPPGHYLAADREGVVERRYWDAAREPGAAVLAGSAAELRARLQDAVGRHLVSDVPVGLFLSGGVDSAGLASLATRAGGAPLRTLTVVFDERAYSEGPAARRIAEAYGTEHQEVLVTGEEFVRELPAFFEAMDQPTNDGVNTYFIAKAARQAGLTVVLSGAGGDEVFWGYPHHRRLMRPFSPLRQLAGACRPIRRLAAAGASTAGRIRGREQWMRLSYLGSSGGADRLYLALRGFFPPRQVAALLDVEQATVHAALEASAEAARPPAAGALRGADAFNYLELRRYLHDQLLRDSDVFGMAHSLEVRVPYLDHRVVEHVAGLPPRLKVDRVLNKPLLCEAVGDPRVTELARRGKRGFSFPLDPWMRAHAGALEEIAGRADGLDRAGVRRLWRAFRSGRLHWSRAWALVILGARSAA